MDILPRDKSDYIPFFMFATVVPSAIAVEFLLLLPQIFADGVLLFWYAVLGYLFTSMYFSWIKLITISTTTKGLLLPNVQKPDWKFCWICEQNSPPRSAHCYRLVFVQCINSLGKILSKKQRPCTLKHFLINFPCSTKFEGL